MDGHIKKYNFIYIIVFSKGWSCLNENYREIDQRIQLLKSSSLILRKALYMNHT